MTADTKRDALVERLTVIRGQYDVRTTYRITIASAADQLRRDGERIAGIVSDLEQAKAALEFMACEDDEAGMMARHPLRFVVAALAKAGRA